MLISVFINVMGDGTGQLRLFLIDEESVYSVVLKHIMVFGRSELIELCELPERLN